MYHYVKLQLVSFSENVIYHLKDTADWWSNKFPHKKKWKYNFATKFLEIRACKQFKHKCFQSTLEAITIITFEIQVWRASVNHAYHASSNIEGRKSVMAEICQTTKCSHICLNTVFRLPSINISADRIPGMFTKYLKVYCSSYAYLKKEKERGWVIDTDLWISFRGTFDKFAKDRS